MPALRKGYNNKLLRTVEQTITAYGMFAPKDSVLVGVSGGPDSVALLYALVFLAPKFSLSLKIAHLNHCLRFPEADNDAKFVSSLAQELSLPIYHRKVDVRNFQKKNRLSQEEAARHLRYDFYMDVASKNRLDKIALGHHCDDNAELILMNLFRGSGPLGISGIPPIRDGKIVRPLIQAKRADIIDFLNSNRIRFVSDRSNLDPKYLRNKIRRHLMPLIKSAYNPKIVDTLNRMASIISLEEEWIDDIIQPVFQAAVLTRQENKLALSVSALDKIHPAALKRVIREAVKQVKGDLRRIAYVHIESATHLIKKASDNWSLDFPGRIRIQRRESVLFIRKELKSLRKIASKSTQEPPFYFEHSIHQPESIVIKEINAQIRFSEVSADKLPDFSQTGHLTGFFDMDSLSFPLLVRNACPGDRFTPLGMTGTQKLTKFFSSQKVPPKQRAKCPVILSRGKIIWVAGYRIDESVKVTASTGKVLKVELLLA